MPRRQGETSYHDTAFGIIPRSKLILLEIEGIARAWEFVLRKRGLGKIPLTSDMMRKIHRVGFGWIFPQFGGKFRIIDVEVSDHKPPKHYLVPQLMLDFSRDLIVRLRHLPALTNQNFSDALIELLTWGHHRFLWIHPFQDYNGRMARLLLNIILLNLDLPPIELNVASRTGRRRYVDALRTADRGTYTPLTRIVRHALEEAAREIKS